MATVKSFTDLQQSHKLAEFLPLESADMHYKINRYNNESRIFMIPYSELGIYKDDDYQYCVCVWSLAALLSVLPEIQGGKPVISLDDNYITYPHMSDLHTEADNLVDACYELILKLKELNLL